MLDAAKAAGVVHATNFNQRGRTPVGRMKQHMDAGYIGRLFHANIWWGQTQAVEDKPEVASWRFKAEDGGGPVYEKMKRRCYYRIGDVEKWLREHEVSSTSDKVEAA